MNESEVQTKAMTAADQLRFIRAIVLAFVGIRLMYAAALQLVPDEATYWVWSRHLAAGYLDHPPGVAFLIRAGTYLLGFNELGVRLATIIMAAGGIFICMAIGRKILRDDRAAVWIGVFWLTSPLLAGLGTLATVDTPADFFSLCALAFALMIADREAPTRKGEKPASQKILWLLFGFFAGLALLCKYTAILLPASIAMAILFSRQGRLHYRRPWIYLGGLVALAVFSPVIWWNARHQWASFLFQLRHGSEGSEDVAIPVGAAATFIRFCKDIVIYIGGQAGLWTPILFAIAIVVLVVYWRRYRSITQVDRVLLWTGSVPLVFFGIMFLKSHHGEGNWPAFAYFPISILTARWLSEKWEGKRVDWARGGVRVALGVLIVMHVIIWPGVTERLLRLRWHIPHALRDTVGWRDFGRALGDDAQRMGYPMVIANRHQDAAEAAFYMPEHPDVWCIGIGSRPTAYDYFDERIDLAKIRAVLWIGGHVDQFEKKYGYNEQLRNDLTFLPGKNQMTFRTYLLVRSSR
jgi:4-amino-4-deoxy-L-arabinose transferase-like glycosyltransferase